MIVPARPVAPRDVAAHYDELDWLYRDIWGEHVHHGLWLAGTETSEQAVEQLVGRVAERARIEAGDAVCDLGCGYGATARWLARRHGARVTGITVAPAQYARAQAAASAAAAEGGAVRFVLGDWLASELPAATFDAVVAIESTEHIADKARCFAEARRVLRPGGRLVICAWLAAERARRWQVRSLLEPICSEGRLAGMGNRSEYLALLSASGLVVESVEDLTDGVKRTWSICIARTASRLVRDRRYRAFLFDRRQAERKFARTLFRIWLAYATGAMRYGLFTAVRAA